MTSRALSSISQRNLLGLAAVLSSGVFFSLSGLMVRLVEADGWQIVFYRGTALALFILSYLVVRYRWCTARRCAAIGRSGLIAGVFLAIANVTLIWSFLHTTVANTVFVFGALPFITGLLAWLFLGERVRGATWLTMAAAFAGISVMTVAGLVDGHFLGNLLAIATTVALAGLVVAMRAGRAIDMTPVLCLGTAAGALAAALVADSLAISVHDFIILLFVGTAPQGVAFVLWMFGTRHVRAAEVSLLGGVESVLAPGWVWLVVSEVPGVAVLAGGAILLLALFGQSLLTARHPPDAIASSAAALPDRGAP